ncbi:hypothetical protein CHUAL_007509 [Chamberlinius hualienensis]
MFKSLALLAFFVAAVYAQSNYGSSGQSAPAYQAAAPLKENFGPDTSNFQYQVPVYDAKTYGKADVNVNRFPGGANYQLDENGQGSNFKLSYEHSGTGKKIKAPTSSY